MTRTIQGRQELAAAAWPPCPRAKRRWPPFWAASIVFGATMFGISCSQPTPEDIGPSGPGTGPASAQVDAAPARDSATVDASVQTDAASPAHACDRLCRLLPNCGDFADSATCIRECSEQILTCTAPEVAQVVQCSPTQYYQCVAVQGCIGDIACFDTWQSGR